MISRQHCELCGYLGSFQNTYLVGGKSYCKSCMEKLRKETDDHSLRILIIDSVNPPSHGGEYDIGHALVRRDGSWYLVIDVLEATNNPAEREQTYSYKLPDDFFVGMTYEKLADALWAVVKKAGGRNFGYVNNAIARRDDNIKLISSLFLPEE